MTRTLAARIANSAAVLALVLVAACSDATSGPPESKPVASVEVAPPTRTLIVGDELTLAATPKAADGEVLERVVTWTSENETFANVSTGGVVRALGAGTVGIRATCEGKFGRAVLTIIPVPPVPVADVRLSVDGPIELEWNGSTQISAVALDAQENELPGRAIQWLTNKPHVATVTNGLIQAVAPGFATISAVIEGVASSVAVYVKAAPILEITIEGPTGLEAGENSPFSAKVRRANGQIAYEPMAWTSSAPDIARVTHVDIMYVAIEALAEGNATLTASKEGASAAVTLRVSPRATHDLIYNRWSGTASEIFLLGLEVEGIVPVRLNAGNVSRDPSPSPDGTQFVFAVSQVTLQGEQQDDLYIVNRNGLNMRWLTRTPGIEDAPQWSPDGTKILFRGTDAAGNSNLYVINVDGTGTTNLTSQMPSDATDKRDPAWSPDGSRIAFIAARNSQHRVWVMNADGSSPTQLTTDAGFDMTPTWSPSGDKIAFSRYNGAAPQYGDDVMIVSVNGGTPTRLALPGDQRHPAWSPDGHYIAVSGNAIAGRDPQEIYTLRPDGTGLRLRTVNPAWGGGATAAWIKRP